MSDRSFAAASLLVAMLLWASSFVALKFAFRYYDPMLVVFGRMLVATLCFALVWRWLPRPAYRPGDALLLCLMVLSEPCLYFLFEARALELTSASQAGVITAMLPLLVAMGAFVWLRERLDPIAWAGFALAMLGAVWLSLGADSQESAPAPLLGNFFEFCAMVCATAYTLCLKRLSGRYSAWLLTAFQAFAGALFFLPWALVASWEQPPAYSGPGLAAIIYLGTLINIGAYGLYNVAVARISASQASAFVNLIPVFTVLLAWWLLGEQLNVEQWLAAALVIGGVFLSQMKLTARAASVAG
ncbi:DMT family transporter [Motiliproteus sp. SC1-56]|uniref:DMT family transporter n=1 Tax=Motiliproteus sp. SC1-56 TaxID=2799565 RepID=UPI001A8DF497|nr:DMT family transporter [Motiliproteus sp. SC1-56]